MALPSPAYPRPPSDKTSLFGTPERYVVASPYTDDAHLLDMETLDRENQLLARALGRMTCTRDDYATAPYVESFNWNECFAELQRLARDENHQWRETSFYIVVFRSQIPPTTRYSDLGELDQAAHLEAVQSGGLLKYWFGLPDAEGRNLATCVWRSVDDARAGGVGPAHRKAAGATRSLYQNWKIDRHRLAIGENLRSWEIVEWQA